MVNRRGSTTIGCLGTILAVVALGYVGSRIAEPYFRYYNYRDAVQQEARFATLRPDDKIRANLWQDADSLEMPEGAFHMNISRSDNEIRIRAAYVDAWNIHTYYVRPVQFNIDVHRPL